MLLHVGLERVQVPPQLELVVVEALRRLRPHLEEPGEQGVSAFLKEDGEEEDATHARHMPVCNLR